MTKPPLTDEEGEVRELTAEDMALFRPIAEIDPGMVIPFPFKRVIVTKRKTYTLPPTP